MSQIEKEPVVLNAAWEMIDGMVNWAMFAKNDLTEPTTLLFESRTHAELFIILLTDFLSPIQTSKSSETAFPLDNVPSNAQGVDRTFIFHLRQVCRKPQLGREVTNLSSAVEEFARWLDTTITSRQVNLSLIDVTADIALKRYFYIKMCGNIAKHGIARLGRVIRALRGLLAEAGHEVSIQEAHQATEQFYSWFFDDVFMFHYNQIVEFLNNIRWHLFEYLLPEFGRSWHSLTRFEGDYGFHVPKSIVDPFAQTMYWDLMNRVRSKPYIRPFVADASFKRPHWSEVHGGQ